MNDRNVVRIKNISDNQVLLRDIRLAGAKLVLQPDEEATISRFVWMRFKRKPYLVSVDGNPVVPTQTVEITESEAVVYTPVDSIAEETEVPMDYDPFADVVTEETPKPKRTRRRKS